MKRARGVDQLVEEDQITLVSGMHCCHRPSSALRGARPAVGADGDERADGDE
jgi:hypothetical protein